MSRLAILNIILGGIAASLVTILVVLETNEDPRPPTMSTTTTTTTTNTTNTTTALPPATTEATTTTSTTTSTSTSTVPPTTEAPDDRFFTGILVVNGTTGGERLQPAINRLRDAGYGQVRGVSGAVLSQETIIYAIDDSFRAEADVVAADLGFAPGAIAVELFENAPPVSGVLEAKIIVYLGPGSLPEL